MESQDQPSTSPNENNLTLPLPFLIKTAEKDVELQLEHVKKLEAELKEAKDKYKEAKDNLDSLISIRDDCNATEKINNMINDVSSDDWLGTEFEWSAAVEDVLRNKFHFESFRPMQLRAINVAMSEKDLIVVMPTGAGKSLVYQIPAIINRGYAIVVVPLVSVAYDQLRALKLLGVEAAAINSTVKKEELKEIYNQLIDENTELKVVFVTPEMLAKNKGLMNRLQKACEMGLISRIVIDEIHCCSMWGYDFRPDYQYLGVVCMALESVPILGLTATATHRVLADIVSMLPSRPNCAVITAPFNRENLYYEVIIKPSKEKHVDFVVNLIRERYPKVSGIVYTNTISDTLQVTNALRSADIKASPYHAQLSTESKNIAHEKWLAGRVKVIVATMAFGMGIDKPDVRFIIHFSPPRNMISFYQESGRAGRDGNRADCVVIYALGDFLKTVAPIHSVDESKKGFEVLEYCVEQQRCRRSIIAEHFNDVWDSSLCNMMCDNCTVDPRNLYFYEVSRICKSLRSIIRSSSERLTLIKLHERWVKENKKGHKVALTRDEIEFIIGLLLNKKYLALDRGYNLYNTIIYLKEGKEMDDDPIILITRKPFDGLAGDRIPNQYYSQCEALVPLKAETSSSPSLISQNTEPVVVDLTLSSDFCEEEETDLECEMNKLLEVSTSESQTSSSRSVKSEIVIEKTELLSEFNDDQLMNLEDLQEEAAMQLGDNWTEIQDTNGGPSKTRRTLSSDYKETKKIKKM